jgi:hypothetical protein
MLLLLLNDAKAADAKVCRGCERDERAVCDDGIVVVVLTFMVRRRECDESEVS